MIKKLSLKKPILEQIKNYLYESEGFDSWEEFVDNQELGQCQSIVASIIDKFPKVKKVFGEITVEEPYYDEDGEEQYIMTHHWVSINGKYYDFSKGTLREYLSFDDIYDPEVEDASIYEAITHD